MSIYLNGLNLLWDCAFTLPLSTHEAMPEIQGQGE